MPERYREILKLRKMLEEAKIPSSFDRYFDGYQLCYPCVISMPDAVCTVFEHSGSYGANQDLLEIIGLQKIDDNDDNLGCVDYLTAQEVFNRIEKHWKAQKEAEKE